MAAITVLPDTLEGMNSFVPLGAVGPNKAAWGDTGLTALEFTGAHTLISAGNTLTAPYTAMLLNEFTTLVNQYILMPNGGGSATALRLTNGVIALGQESTGWAPEVGVPYVFTFAYGRLADGETRDIRINGQQVYSTTGSNTQPTDTWMLGGNVSSGSLPMRARIGPLLIRAGKDLPSIVRMENLLMELVGMVGPAPGGAVMTAGVSDSGAGWDYVGYSDETEDMQMGTLTGSITPTIHALFSYAEGESFEGFTVKASAPITSVKVGAHTVSMDDAAFTSDQGGKYEYYFNPAPIIFVDGQTYEIEVTA